MTLGVSYYPEFYTKEAWRKDVDGIAEIGFQVVRMAEFSWCRLEPKEGEYDFSWLDEIIAMFAEKGIQTILGTPTGAPPQWILTKYLDLPLTDSKRTPNYIHGGFGNYCKNHPGYRAYSKKIVSEMAKHYKGNPNVILYQIDNEFTGSPCYCEHCTKAYTARVKEKYKTIEAYNDAMMLIFQGRELASFDEIQPLISQNQNTISPSLLMEYRKFTSDTYIDYCHLQVDAIRAEDPDVEITTNYNTLFESYDHFKMGERFDVAGCDTYPKADGDFSLRNALKLDLCRSVKKKNFWVLEQQCSPVAFREYNYALEPLEARLFTYKSIAHGADGVVYFRWNAPHAGMERFGAGIIRHDGNKERTYHEVKRTSDEIKVLAPFLEGSQKKTAKAAIIFSNISTWTLSEGRKITQDLNYMLQLRALYQALLLENIDVDFVHSGDDLSAYQVVYAPALVAVSQQDANWLSDYVAAGGNCVFGVQSGMFDENNVISDNYYQGVLRDLLGIRVTEWTVPYQGEASSMCYNGKSYPADLLNMVLELEGASALATYETGFYKGSPAVTVNEYGQGKAYYWATMSSLTFTQTFTEDCFHLTEDLGMTLELVDVKIREKDGKRLYILMNHQNVAQEITLTKFFVNALDGAPVASALTLAPYDVCLLYEA